MHRKKPLKVAVDGMHQPNAYYLMRLLSRRYDVEFVDEADDSPDLFFCPRIHPYQPSANKEFDAVNCLRIFNTIENVKPDFRFFDYAFSFEDTGPRNFCFPHFVSGFMFEKFRSGQYSNKLKEYREYPKSRFCAFVYSAWRIKQGAKARINFCRKLMSYKRVDCAGNMLRNMPQLPNTVEDRCNFMKQYKFTISFENVRSPNYVTEKIFDALLVNSIPIYWGSPRIAEYFNPEAFINCHDYDNFDRVIDRVIEVDNNDDLYQKYVNAPPVLEGSRAHAISEKAIMERLDEIVNSIGVVMPVSGTVSYKLRVPLYRCLYRFYIKRRNEIFAKLAGRLRFRQPPFDSSGI